MLLTWNYILTNTDQYAELDLFTVRAKHWLMFNLTPKRRTTLFFSQSVAECSWRQHSDLDESLVYLKTTGCQTSSVQRLPGQTTSLCKSWEKTPQMKHFFSQTRTIFSSWLMWILPILKARHIDTEILQHHFKLVLQKNALQHCFLPNFEILHMSITSQQKVKDTVAFCV